MKIKELLYETPEMTEEHLLVIMGNHLDLLSKYFKNRIREIHKEKLLVQALLDEYDLIQDKKSFLTKSQREEILGFVGMCMIEMAKGNDGTSGE